MPNNTPPTIPTIIPIDDKIQIQELNPGPKKINPIVTQTIIPTIYEIPEETNEITNEQEEIPTIIPSTPKPLHTGKELEDVEVDTSWLNEEKAEQTLQQDRYTNPAVNIETPSNFGDVSEASAEELDSQENETPVNIQERLEQNLVTDATLVPTMDEGVVIGVDMASGPDESVVQQVNTPTPVVLEEEPLQIGIDTPITPDIQEDWIDNVTEDKPKIDPDLKPGMENTMNASDSQGPVLLDDIDDQEEGFELADPEIQPEPVEPKEETQSIATADLPEPDEAEPDPANENMLGDDEAPIIPSYDFFHQPTKETLVPLQRDELTMQFAEIFADEEHDTPHIQKIKARAVGDPTTYPSYVARASNFISPEQLRLDDVFRKMPGPVGAKKQIDDKVYGDPYSGKNNSRPIESTSIVGGEKAYHTAMALISGIRKIALYNSGFNITIRPPLISELHQFYMRTRSASQEFGRQFGQYAFIPADVELKIASMELFKSLVLDSNLVNWRDPGVLERNISIFDYDTCLWGMATLMFPEGTEVEMFCNKRDCNYVDQAKIDIVKMRFNDYSRISNEAVKYTCSSNAKEMRTEEDLKNYREQMMKESEIIQLNDEWSVSVETPSIAKYIEDGTVYAADMAAKIQKRNHIDVADYIRCKYFRIFAPWIKRVSFLDKRTGHYKHWIDPLKLPDIIESLQLNKDKLQLDTKLAEYMNEKRVSYYGYLYSVCPNCQTAPDVAINGIIPCDIQHSFFTLTMDRIS